MSAPKGMKRSVPLAAAVILGWFLGCQPERRALDMTDLRNIERLGTRKVTAALDHQHVKAGKFSLRATAQNSGDGKEDYPTFTAEFPETENRDWRNYMGLLYWVYVDSDDSSVDHKDISLVVYERGSSKQQYHRHNVPIRTWTRITDDMSRYDRSEVARVSFCLYETQPDVKDKYTWYICGLSLRRSLHFDDTTWAGGTTPAKPAKPVSLGTEDGLALGADAEDPCMQWVTVDGKPFSRKIYRCSGFHARDAATDSDLIPAAGTIQQVSPRAWLQKSDFPGINVELEARYEAKKNHVRVEGTIRDTGARDRAVCVYYLLPVDCREKVWWDDVRSKRPVQPGETYSNLTRCGAGYVGELSLYPYSVLSDDHTALSFAIPMDEPRVFQIGADSGISRYFICFDLALTKDTKKFPSCATFSFILFKTDPEWGFRSAVEKYADIFPHFFMKRCKKEGIWMAFTDIATVEDPADFGFVFHEIGGYLFRESPPTRAMEMVGFDDRVGINSFHYTEPMSYWMAMPPEEKRTYEAAMKRLEIYRSKSKPPAAGEVIQVSSYSWAVPACAVKAHDGRYDLSFRDTSWCNGALFILNPDPEIPEGPNCPLNKGHINYTKTYADKTYTSPSGAERENCIDQDVGLDGEYLDSLEMRATINNFRRDHFAISDIPLTFCTQRREPILLGAFQTYEFVRYISEDIHRRGKLMMANACPIRFFFLAHCLDVMGTETNWLKRGKDHGVTYTPWTDAFSNYRRTICYQKPYLILMNTNFDEFTREMTEDYVRRCLFYGFYPSFFNGTYKRDNKWIRFHYWTEARFYNRDRDLYRRFVPLIQFIGKAGWEPVTYARCDDPDILTERFGDFRKGDLCFTLLNAGEESRNVTLKLDEQELGVRGPHKAVDLVERKAVKLSGNRVSVQMEPGAVALVHVGSPQMIAKSYVNLADGELYRAIQRLRYKPIDQLTAPEKSLLAELSLLRNSLGRAALTSAELTQVRAAFSQPVDIARGVENQRVSEDIRRAERLLTLGIETIQE